MYNLYVEEKRKKEKNYIKQKELEKKKYKDKFNSKWIINIIIKQI